MSNHWHVATGIAGYGPDAANDNWSTATTATELADAVNYELRGIAESEYEAAQALGELEEYKDAWLTLKHSDELDTLARNFDNERVNAPLYRDDPKLWEDTVYRLARESFPVGYATGSRLYVWECSAPDCETYAEYKEATDDA